MNTKAGMFHQSLKRLFLILFPIILFIIALCLSSTRQAKQSLSPPKASTLNKNCPFYFGVSFFSQTDKFQANKLTTYTLNEMSFIKKIQDLNLYFQKEDIDLRQVFFAIPITLTKKEEWIVSQKTFFILPTGERKQISHLTYSEINDFHNFSKNMNQDYKVLKLNKILSFLPNRSNFLFYLVGSNREKMIKNLEKTQSKITGDLYLSSSNEKILKDLMFLQASLNSTLKPEVKILHSFKALIRLELLSFFPHAFKKVLGQGLIVPNSFSPSYEILNLLKQENKLLFFEKNPPYTSQDQHLIKNSQALISSHVKLAISSIKDEKSCLIKN